MYSYILIQFEENNQELLQETLHGQVVRYTTLDGVTANPPPGGSQVINSAYPTPEWSFYEEPTPEVQPNTDDYRITNLAFRERFTDAEKVTLEIASLDTPDGTQQARSLQAALRVYMKDLDAAKYIDLSREDTIAAVNQLETLGLIAEGRANQILTNPIQDIERLSD